VAATDCNDSLAYFSCYGLNSVDVGAPGVDIFSTYPTYMTSAMTQSKMPTHYYAISGTSMATPHVAGACALLAAEHPELTAAQLKAQLLIQTDRIPALKGKCVTGARLNASKAMTISPVPILRVWRAVLSDAAGGDGDGTFTPGETLDVTVTLVNGGLEGVTNVNATLATTDPQVTVLAGAAAFGDIPGLSERQAAGPFRLKIAPTCPTPHEVTLALTVTDAAGRTWTDQINFTVVSWYQIAGTITLDGAPAAGVQVRCYNGPMPAAYFYTDALGHYRCDVIDGTYTLYARLNYPGAGNLSAAFSVPVVVTVAPSRTDLDFAFTTVKVAGHVTDARTGQPLAGAAVESLPAGYAVEDGGGLFGSTATDAAGYYELAMICAHSMREKVGVWMAGYVNSALHTVTVPPGTLTEDFALTRPDASAAPVPAAIEVTGVLGQTLTRTLTLGNPGAEALVWRLWHATDGVSPNAGQVLRQLSLSSSIRSPVGLAFDGNVLWVTDLWLPAKLWKLDAASGTVLLGTETRVATLNPWGLDWDGQNLWLADYDDKAIFAVDADVTRVLKRTQAAAVSGIQPDGVVFGGGSLWVVDADQRRVTQFDVFTGLPLSSWPLPEGGTAAFRLKLAAAPTNDVTVTVVHSGGDGDITVQSGASLTFTTGNWNTWQTVTLAAAEDDDTDRGSATITCTADELADVMVTATEVENDVPPPVDTDGDGLPDAVEVRLGRATNVAEQVSALPFVERFESDTVTLGELNGQNKWVAVPANAALVQTDDVFEGVRALKIANTGTKTTAVSQVFTGAPLTVVWLDLRQKVAGATVPDSVPDAAVAMLFNNDGRLTVCDGACPTGAEWVVLTNHTPRTAGTWARLTARVDYASQTWALYLDGTAVAENLGFASPQTRPTCLSFEGSGAVLDDLYVGLARPAGFPGAGNIVPDEWYLGYFGEIRADGADSDGDGMSNLHEYLAGTHPDDDTSYLGFMGVSVVGVPGEFLVRWQSVSNKFYTLQAATNLLEGFTLILGTNIQATPPENVHTDNVESVEQRFYRVKVE